VPKSSPPALELSLDLLRCPTCGAPGLRPDRGALRCPSHHTFNLARHGYVSLLSGARTTSGDSADMARAREGFLATGAYAPIRDALVRLATAGAPARATVVDVGCGTGYYLAGVLERLPDARGLGLDTSVRALRSAARAHQRALAATWDVFRPFPLADAVADVLLDVFSPRNPSEFHRVLRGTGRLVVARPTDRHLAELRGRVPGMVSVDVAKEQRLHDTLAPYFEALGTDHVEYAASLTQEAATDLVMMTPSARHVASADLGTLPELVTISVLVTAYRPR
jgi:23S rRNA (guanine745-N1)-methyltransferase